MRTVWKQLPRHEAIGTIGTDDHLRAKSTPPCGHVHTIRILRDPLTRARYLLGEVWEKAQKADKTMLHEAMLQREALEEADSSSALERIKKDAAEKEAAALRELAAAFAEGNLVHACQLTLRLGYMHRLKDAIRMKTLAAAHA